ncbi:MAG: hypothetical protein MJZ93_07305, partial [Paludibacteraceae bacterium]|nr:hypothetical protein [Paludibacteraceae bacterium]
MKVIQTIVCLLLPFMVCCQNPKPYEFSIKATRSFTHQAEAMADSHDWVSFSMDQTNIINGNVQKETTYQIAICYKKDNAMVYVCIPSIGVHFMLNDKHMMEISNDNRTITVYKRKLNDADGTNWYHEVGENKLHSYLYELWYYLSPLSGVKTTQTAFFLTDWNEKGQQRIYHGHAGRRYVYNKNSNKYDLPIDYLITCYVNNVTNIMDSMKSVSVGMVDEETTLRVIRDVSYQDRQSEIDSIFDLLQPEYALYTRHDEQNPLEIGSINKDCNDIVRDFPLVKVDNDCTTNIGMESGWLLLNFWSFHCAPCIGNLKRYGHEMDSLGYRILEKEGVKIIAVNYSSDNTDLITDIGVNTKTSDILYSAKGMNAIISIPTLGYYYLISPNKEIVYETNNLGDYSELLKAKAKY